MVGAVLLVRGECTLSDFQIEEFSEYLTDATTRILAVDFVELMFDVPFTLKDTQKGEIAGISDFGTDPRIISTATSVSEKVIEVGIFG